MAVLQRGTAAAGSAPPSAVCFPIELGGAGLGLVHHLLGGGNVQGSSILEWLFSP